MSYTAILGASGTIGAALARALTSEGRQALLLGRNAEKLELLAAELNQPFAVFDPQSSASLESAVNTALSGATLGAIVNCIGSVVLKPAHATSDDEFRQTFETNLFTSFAAIRLAAKTMRSNGGSVVLLASAAAETGIQNHEAIAAAKAGVIGLARSAAATYAPFNLRVNVVSPGLVKTEMTRRIWENSASASASIDLHALGRLGEPAAIVAAIRWFIDPHNDWVTGQILGVDGGLGHVLPRRKSTV